MDLEFVRGVAFNVARRTYSDIDDLKQEATIALWQAYKNLDEDRWEAFPAYARQAVVNACVREAWDQRACTSAGRSHPSQNCCHFRLPPENVISPYRTPEELLDEAQFAHEVRERVRALGRETAALQVVLGDRPVGDVAREHRMTYFEVYRAVERLRDRLRNDRKCRNLLDSRKL